MSNKTRLLFIIIVSLVLGITGCVCWHNSLVSTDSTTMIKPRAYQIQVISQDSMYLYDGNRLVARLFLTDDSEIGYAIIYDKH